MKPTLVIVLFFMVSLERTSSNYKTQNDIPNRVQVKRSYADLLGSLIKVNKERVKALKKLYLLNSITYGKNALRSNIEQKLDDYDKMEERLISTLKDILDEPKLDLTKAQNLDPNDISKILSSEETDPSDQYKPALRKNVASSDSEKYNSTEMEKLVFLPNNTHKYIKTSEVIDSSFEDVTDGKTGQSLRGKEELKCIDACAEVFNNVCDSHNCKVKERHVFGRQCFSACRSRF